MNFDLPPVAVLLHGICNLDEAGNVGSGQKTGQDVAGDVFA